MSLLLDFILVLVFVLCVYTGVKRGFIRSVMSIAVVVLAIIGSIKLTPPFSAYLNEKYIESEITGKVEQSIHSILSGVDSIDLSKLFNEKPQAFTDILKKFGMNFDDVNTYYENEAKESEEAEKAVSSFIAKPISETLSKAIAFAVLFISFSIVLTIIMLVIDLVVKIPILNGINKSFGLIIGILKGVLYAWGLSLIFYNLLPHLAVVYEGKIPASIIDNTIIVRFLGAINISSLF